MSFFGLETNHHALEEEKEKFLEGSLAPQEDVAVFNWGESDYDGLGEALQEGGDEMNDETFGDGPVGASIVLSQTFTTYLTLSGKDFDFSNHALPEIKNEKPKPGPRREYQDSLLHGKAQPSCEFIFFHSL